ncbi:MAG: hypothetical protein LBH57_02375 [Treponema sp.]|nr:hypothetical protein [Treponema sp.]
MQKTTPIGGCIRKARQASRFQRVVTNPACLPDGRRVAAAGDAPPVLEGVDEETLSGMPARLWTA